MRKLRQGIRQCTTPKRLMGTLLPILLLILCAPSYYAQSIYATLTGIVADPSGAVIPQAAVRRRSRESTNCWVRLVS